MTTAKVESKALPVTVPAVGTAEAQQTVQVRAQVTGQLSVVHFTEGQEVKKGQELFTIDQRPFQAALSQAQAVLARDTATANNTHDEILAERAWPSGSTASFASHAPMGRARNGTAGMV